MDKAKDKLAVVFTEIKILFINKAETYSYLVFLQSKLL